MRVRCLQPSLAQVLLVSAGLLVLTLYHQVPTIVTLRTPAPSPSPTLFPTRTTPTTSGGKAKVVVFTDSDDYPISLERDTGADSMASQVMLAAEFLARGQEWQAWKEKIRVEKERRMKKKVEAEKFREGEVKKEDVIKDREGQEWEKGSNTAADQMNSNLYKHVDAARIKTPYPTSTTPEAQHPTPSTQSKENPITEPNTKPNSTNSNTEHSKLNQNTTNSNTEQNLPQMNRTCTVTTRPLRSCNCTRTVSMQSGSICPKDGGTVMASDMLLAKLNETFGSSTCSDDATLRGANQRVISFSLYGTFPNEYHASLSEVVARAGKSYPGWAVRVYHDLDLQDPSKKAWACDLACRFPQLDLCFAGSLPGIGDIRSTIGTIWRVAVLGDPLVQRFIVRDVDSPVLQREVDAVNDWISSGKCFHLMRDNPFHTMPIMAGMFGGCGFWHREVLERIRGSLFRFSGKKSHKMYYDQINEGRLLWPTIKKNHIAHDSYFCRQFPKTRPFPTQRVNRTFVGMRIYREEFKTDMIYKPCPKACRPPNHKDWEFC